MNSNNLAKEWARKSRDPLVRQIRLALGLEAAIAIKIIADNERSSFKEAFKSVYMNGQMSAHILSIRPS